MAEENNKQEQEQTNAPNATEDIQGSGAADHYGESKDEVKGGDTEKAGVKPPDAMGAGQ